MRKQYDILYNVTGTVLAVHWKKMAEIAFTLYDKGERALLDKGDFFHNDQRIPVDEPLDLYIQPGIQVKFNCKYMEPSTEYPLPWMVIHCCLRYPSPFGHSIRLTGIPGRIASIGGRHGTVQFRNERNIELVAYFDATVVHDNGKALCISRPLSSSLKVGETVYLDVIPCIPSENSARAPFVALKVNKQENSDFPLEIPTPLLRMAGQGFTLRQIYKLFHGRYTAYVRGRGRVARMLNAELGVIEGEITFGCTQPIVFHRHSTNFLQMCLPETSRRYAFRQGDSVSFVAARSSFGGGMEWVAIQLTEYNFEEYGPLPPSSTNLDINKTTDEFLTFTSHG